MLRRGSGYGIAGPTWREGKRQRPAARPRDVKAAARKLKKRLIKHGSASPHLLDIANALGRCDRRHRCLHPACPQCGRAVQRTFVRALYRFIEAHEHLGPWVMLSLILPPLDPEGEIDFVAERARYTAVLRRAGLRLGAFGLDLSFNEDDRRTLPEADRFAPHPCVHIYGIAPAAHVEAALPKLRRLVPATNMVCRPIRRKRFNGDPAAFAYSHKPRFTRRLTILRDDPRRASPVRTTRDRVLTVEQEIRAVRALARAGLTGRIVLLGVHFELVPIARPRRTLRT
ncbi:hypothetical protein [Methylorubrum sp. SB2]|uniref:hypothetical protein n=1 Tax=Methylorubrum subtropicum TaxID=3138812 RepID=UPI00313EE8F7